MDSDCLVKLTKAGIKESIVSAMEVHIPPLVKKETVDEAKGRGFQDAVEIEGNIARRRLHVANPHKKKIALVSASKGEEEVVSLFEEGNYDAIASDDRRFLKILDAARIPYLTPGACLVYMHKNNRSEREKAMEMLESLKPFISSDEYVVTKLYLEGRS
ncbi:MAG TPA: hypothetical protein VLD55_07560 [Candidatus Sulfobium mesophilum]|nr:hypothetical protein [Candidatus Sulfobium mesophilum]